MTQIFTSAFGRRRVFVDEDGVHEERRGLFTRFIPWNDLIALSNQQVRGSSGTRIRIGGFSPPDKCRPAISACWKERYPEPWGRNHRQGLRSAKRDAFLFLPGLVFGLHAAVLLTLHWWPLPEAARQELREKMLHNLNVAFVLMPVAVATLAWSIRKTAQEAAEQTPV